ncbi:MAG: hypothetical protein GAK43_02119 [Stenotrophomonas maltophilia]|nr:MAG: hypothetical protein GAK43_02119 [Stenotrophomonas maltophilia]
MQPRDLAIYLFLAVTWGLSFLVLLQVVQAFDWAGAVALRSLVASFTLLGLARLLGRRVEIRAHRRHLLVLGATTVAGQLIGLSYATPRIGTAMAAIFVAAIPLFSMLIGRLWGLEKIRAQGVVGLLLGLLGLLLMVGFPAVTIDRTFILGCLASLGGALCGAFGSNYAALHLRGVAPWSVTAGAFLFGGLLVLPLLLVVPIPRLPTLSDVAFLLLSGSGMSALTYVLYFGLVARIGATRTISVEFVITVIAVMVGAGVLGEPLSWLQYLGASTILAGCALVLGLWPGSRRRTAAVE